MAEYRTERAGRLIQEIISSLILEGRIKDPRIDPFLSITRVSVSGDFSWAEVYVSRISGDLDSSRGVEGLQNAAGFIQLQLARTMHVRKIPRLRFHGDRSIREGFDMIKKIEGLERNGENGR